MKTIQYQRALWSCAVFVFLSTNVTGHPRAQNLKQQVRALYGNNEEMRSAAGRKLVESGPAAIPLLMPVICNGEEPNFAEAWPTAARALGKLKAAVATDCLVQLLGLADPTLSIYKSEKTIAAYDPAFAALIEIGEPAVPGISRSLPNASLDKAYLALRILRAINTPESKAAADTYMHQLKTQTRLATEVLHDFSYGPGLRR